MNESSPWERTRTLGIEQFGPNHILSEKRACDSLFKQFVKVMHRVYDEWHDLEPEYSEQEIWGVVDRWRENYFIASVRWGEAEQFRAGVQELIEKMLAWKPRGMTDSIKAGAMTKERMALVKFLKDDIASKQSTGSAAPNSRLEWRGSTISFIEILEGLVRKGYLEIPEGNMTELIRRVQRSIVVLKEEDGSELTTESLANRLRGTRNEALRAKMDALPEAHRKKPKGG